MWLMFFLVLRVVLRKPLLVAGGFVAFWTGFVVLRSGLGHSPIPWTFLGLAWTIVLAVSLRCGLTAAAVLSVVVGLLNCPVSSDLSAWYVRSALYSIGAVIARAGYGFVTSPGGRPLFGQGWLGEG